MGGAFEVHGEECGGSVSPSMCVVCPFYTLACMGVFAPQAEGLSVCQFRGCVAFCICNVGWLSLYREMCMARACFGAGCLRVDRCGVCGCAIYR